MLQKRNMISVIIFELHMLGFFAEDYDIASELVQH